MEEIAESMDEVRPRGRSPGRTVESLDTIGSAVDGDPGGDPGVNFEDGNGDETFRN